jgi:hypothetical protein
VFEWFTTDRLTVPHEADIVEAWLDHMEAVRRRLAPEVARPLVFHWSHAEPVNLSSLLESARQRNPDRQANWPEPAWYDFLTRVMRVEPVGTVSSPPSGPTASPTAWVRWSPPGGAMVRRARTAAGLSTFPSCGMSAPTTKSIAG